MLTVILGVLARIFSNSFSNVLQKKLTVIGEQPSIINFYTYLGLFLIGTILCGKLIFNEHILMYAVIMGILGAAGNYFIIKSLSIGELSALAPINAYKPVVGIIIGILLLNEYPSSIDLAAISLIIFGTFILTNGISGGYKAFMYRFLALIFSGSEAVFIKKIILLSNIESAFFYWALAGLIFASPAIIKYNPKVSKFSIKLLIVLIITSAIMQYTTNYVFSKINVSHALALFQLSILVSVYFGVNLFKESDILKKLVASAIMTAGAVLLLI